MTYQDPRDIQISPNVWLVRLDLSEQKETQVDTTSTVTTEIGTWATLGPASSATTLTAYVGDALAEYADDYDVPAIVQEYRDRINSALPDGVILCGEEYFVGPYRRGGWEPEDLEAVRTAIADVPLWDIIERSQRDTGQDTSERPEDAVRHLATELIRERAQARATIVDLRQLLQRLMQATNGRDVADAAYRIELRMAGEDAITRRHSDPLYGQARVAAARVLREQAHDQYMQAIEEVKVCLRSDQPV